MVTIDFIKLAMNILITERTFCLADNAGSGNIAIRSIFGTKELEWERTEDATSVTVKTKGDPVYFDEHTSAYAVDRVCSVDTSKNPYYSLPLQHQVTVQPGYQIKINPYKEDASGNHTRGIMVKFSIPEV